ncbi:lipopolysaccharide biosynthesis protein [Clostridium ganghwense]|uniref:Oligosaccharide flippase family protein n=1 Tax=Clostridium ganghwense TaxID=312089 RepID=A0ABT4CNI1_9CLOT|nr:oligosaccharide flippase family protein [Clostridium ganghwense]MCY6370503.1 oligosaccharide flippase family protein [Clostridium ganghwense]
MIKVLTQKLYKSNLIKGGIWYTIGNLFLQGISFLTTPIFTRMLSTSEYGVLGVYSTWLAIFTSIISLGLVSSVSRAKYDFEEQYNDFLSSILLLSTICFGVFVVLSLAFQSTLSDITGLESTVIKLLIIQSFCAFVIDFCNTKLTIQYNYKKYLFIAITSTLLNVMLSITFISYLSVNKYMGRIGGGVLVTGIYAIVLYFSIMKKGKISISNDYWKYALAISIPLIPHSLSGIILAQFDRIMIKKYIGDSATGIYSFAYNMGLILSVVWAALNKAWVPYFFENMKKKNYDDIKKKYKYYIAIFSMITFILIFISPEIVKIMSPKAYWDGLKIVPIVMISYFFIFLYSLPSNLEFYAKKTYLISIGTFGAGFTNIFLNYLFIPRYGYEAGAWTTLVSYVLLFIYHYIMAKIISEEKIFEIKYFIYSIVFVSGVGYIFYLLKDNWMIRYIFVIFVIAILGYSSKNIIKEKLKKI